MVVLEGVSKKQSMPCSLLIHFIEDMDIDGLFVDHFPKNKEKVETQFRFLISEFLNDHRLQYTLDTQDS